MLSYALLPRGERLVLPRASTKLISLKVSSCSGQECTSIGYSWWLHTGWGARKSWSQCAKYAERQRHHQHGICSLWPLEWWESLQIILCPHVLTLHWKKALQSAWKVSCTEKLLRFKIQMSHKQDILQMIVFFCTLLYDSIYMSITFKNSWNYVISFCMNRLLVSSLHTASIGH